jgi:hypothetical protein
MITRTSTHGLLILLAVPFAACGIASAQPAQLGITGTATYSGVMQGYQDPYYSNIYNFAPSGSAALNFTTYANFPYGTSSFGYTGTLVANGGATVINCPFTFDTSQVAPGTYALTAKGINNVSGNTVVSNPTNVTVYAHPKPSLVINGSIVSLNQSSSTKFITTTTPANPGAPGNNPSMPDLTDASLPPQEAGTEGPAGGFAPGMIGDPPADIPSAELDLDSVTSSGDSEIVYDGPVTFQDMPATDNPLENVLPISIDLYTTNVGITYSNTFTFDYSDEQDIPGADAPGSEQESFTVDGTLNSDGSISWDVLTVPEPRSLELSLVVFAFFAGLRTFRTRLSR